MKIDLLTIGDAFVNWLVGPVKPILITGKLESHSGSKKFEIPEACIMSRRILGQRVNMAQGIIKCGGGSASNVAVATSKLNANCGIVARIGEDRDGEFLVKEMQKVGINTSQVIIDKKEKTGISICLLDEQGERTNIIFLGANVNLCQEDVDLNLKESQSVHIANYFLLPRLFNEPIRTITKKIKQMDISISLDPGPIPLHYNLRQVRSILSCLKFVDIFLPTIDEAMLITGEESPKK
jgi:sugar/nucleoside kinase (ribokinase family)